MQNQLNQYPSDHVRVYVVWIPMLSGDSRDDWDLSILPDPRVLHFWDGEYLTGSWFANEVDGYNGIAWDIYYLYGSNATWETVPSPLISSGRTIYRERETLRTQLLKLLNE